MKIRIITILAFAFALAARSQVTYLDGTTPVTNSVVNVAYITIPGVCTNAQYTASNGVSVLIGTDRLPAWGIINGNFNYLSGVMTNLYLLPNQINTNILAVVYQVGGNLTNLTTSVSNALAALASQTPWHGDIDGGGYSLSNFTLVGVSDGSSAATGMVGEEISDKVAPASSVNLTSASVANVANVTVAAGEWAVCGNINFSAATATYTAMSGGISTSSATIPTDGTEVYSGLQGVSMTMTNSITAPTVIFHAASTTTFYLCGRAVFSAGTMKAFGSVNAYRIR